MKKRSAEKIFHFKSDWAENGSYKLVALFISLILWLTILGRREFVVNKEVEVDFTPGASMIVAFQSDVKVRVKLSGSQSVLKKYKDSNQALQINLADRPPGNYEIDITASKIDAPQGVKVISIKPKSIRVEIVPQQN